jgi:signal transduction histidine kinase
MNAADAMEGSARAGQGEIRIAAESQPSGRLSLTIEDSGPGIPAEVLPRLFDPFFTTKPRGKGTGLGLALCREYVHQAGGTIRAENRPDGGARFTIELPASLVQAA